MNGSLNNRKDKTMVAKNRFKAEKVVPEIKGYLTELEKTKKPGEASGEVSKMELLESLKDDIMKLKVKGYTVKQIADAINKGDTFSILPKSITQMINKYEVKKNAPRKRKAKDPEQAQNKPESKADNKPESKAGTFDVKPDSDEL